MRVIDGAGGVANTVDGVEVDNLDLCVYHQVSSLQLDQSSGVPTPEPDLTTMGAKGVIYNAGTGRVESFIN